MYTNIALLLCYVLQMSNCGGRLPPCAAAVGTGATVRPALVCGHQAQRISYQSAFVSAEDNHPCPRHEKSMLTYKLSSDIYFIVLDWFSEAHGSPRLCSVLTELSCVFEINRINSLRLNFRLRGPCMFYFAQFVV